MNALSILCLSLVGVLCAVGVFHPRYDDTLGERIGMAWAKWRHVLPPPICPFRSDRNTIKQRD